MVGGWGGEVEWGVGSSYSDFLYSASLTTRSAKAEMLRRSIGDRLHAVERVEVCAQLGYVCVIMS